jgi:Uma2 family endonuclease
MGIGPGIDSSLPQQVSPSETGQGLILHGISWATYERLLADYQDSHAAHFAYDQGELEIMVLSLEHERLKHTLATLVEVLAEEMGIDVDGVGSTTFQREDLAKGFEPDACFYIQQAEQVAGKKRIDLSEDPPPDLVIEIDITNPSLNKFPIYAQIGVPEIWHYDGQTLSVLKREDQAYTLVEASVVLPGIPSAQLLCFIHDSESLKRTVWLRQVREWVRQNM